MGSAGGRRLKGCVGVEVGWVLAAAEGADGGSVAVGFVGADAANGHELGDGARGGLDEGAQDGVREDEEGRFAGLIGLCFAPFAEAGFELGLERGVFGVRFFSVAFGAAAFALGRAGPRSGVGGLGQEDAEGFGEAEFSSFVGEVDLLVGDFAAEGVGPGFGGKCDEASAGEAVEEAVEVFAVFADRRVSEEAACGHCAVRFENGEDCAEVAIFGWCGVGVALRRSGVGRAEVAMAAGTAGSGAIAEVADQGGHAALRGLSEFDDAVELGAAVGELGFVSGAPCVRAGGADLAVHVELGCALRAELLDGFAERFGIHVEAVAEWVGQLEVGSEEAGYAVQIFDGRVVALEEAFVDATIGEAVKEDGAGGEAVAAGAADFLVVGFDGAGQRGVEDGANVGLVDAHAEGDGGYDDVELAGLELALDALTGGCFEAGVVGGSGEQLVELEGEVVGCLAGWGVDDGGARCGNGQELRDEFCALRLGELDDFDGEIVAAKAVDVERGIGETKLRDDVLLDDRRGGGGERDDGRGAEEREIVAEGAVVGAEIVTPAGDAVGLVDGDQGGATTGKHLGESGNAEAFGGDEEEPEGAIKVCAAGFAGVVARKAGVDACDLEAFGGELGCLIVHEGDEGAHDEGGASASNGGKLVAEALTRAGRHDEEDVASLGHGTADDFLIFAEAGEAKGGSEEGDEIH